MRPSGIFLPRSVILFLIGMAYTGPAIPQSNAVSVKVFDNITAPALSQKLPNIGQSMHIVSVRFAPTTPATSVTGLRVRLEASFDDQVYFPIQADITTVSRLGSQLYTIATAYAPWPYLRIRSLTTAPYAMTVYYTGQLFPIGPAYPTTSTDRMIL